MMVLRDVSMTIAASVAKNTATLTVLSLGHEQNRSKKSFVSFFPLRTTITFRTLAIGSLHFLSYMLGKRMQKFECIREDLHADTDR